MPAQRASTTALLFSLIKRPGPEQRRALAEACGSIARAVGDARTADELVPQCFQQVTHKHEERRLLVADTCGRLAAWGGWSSALRTPHSLCHPLFCSTSPT